MSDVDARLARLEVLSSAELKAEWRTLTGTPLPRVSPSLLRLALAWEIQAKAYGGLPREVTRKGAVSLMRTALSTMDRGL